MKHSIKRTTGEVLTRHADLDDGLVELGMAVVDDALVVSTVGGVQVEHVHCRPVSAVHLSVAPPPGWDF